MKMEYTSKFGATFSPNLQAASRAKGTLIKNKTSKLGTKLLRLGTRLLRLGTKLLNWDPILKIWSKTSLLGSNLHYGT